MVYVPVTYVPDGVVTSRLKRRVKGRKPRPELGNLGPLLDENLAAAKKHGHFLYRPDDLRLLKGVRHNPEVVDEGFAALREVMVEKGIDEPAQWKRTAPYYPDTPRIARRAGALAAAMVVLITAAVLLGQDDHIAAMTVAIVAISIGGAVLVGVIFSRTVIRVDVPDLDT